MSQNVIKIKFWFCEACPSFILFIYFFVNSGVHVTVETLLEDKELKGAIKDLVNSSGRSSPQVEGAFMQQNETTSAILISDKRQFDNGQGKIAQVTQLNGIPQKESHPPI